MAFALPSLDCDDLIKLCGPFNQHLKQIESVLGIRISNRGNDFKLISPSINKLKLGKKIIFTLYSDLKAGMPVDEHAIYLLLKEIGQLTTSNEKNCKKVLERTKVSVNNSATETKQITIKTPKGLIKPRGINQQSYVRTILENDINFGVGPAGTGKTFLAVACAVQSLEENRVQRILLVRPAVEAGEKLGFLPGDLSQKIDPYLRPLYDALYEMLGFERVSKLIERNIIEVAPLAYMRGRTLNHAFIILDESQNTTIEQMKMFLTRIGFGSTAVVTGDVTQVDLPRGVRSGLNHAVEVLKGVKGIGHLRFTSKDVVRHPLVQDIVEAYQVYEQSFSASSSDC